MRQLETYHHNFSEAGNHTFRIGANPKYQILVKNLTSSNISVSYGTTIDTEHDSYSYLPKHTAEIIGYAATKNNENVEITVNAEGTGLVELRIIHNDD